MLLTNSNVVISVKKLKSIESQQEILKLQYGSSYNYTKALPVTDFVGG
jgi:hypothetical protein